MHESDSCIKLVQDKNSSRVDCSGDISLSEVETVHMQLKEALRSTLPIHVNTENVEGCHTAFIQLLVSLAKSASAQNIPCTFENPSKAVANAIQLAGLRHVIQYKDLTGHA